jgi:hypothetical protein
MSAIEDLGDVIDQLTDRRERTVTVLRRGESGRAERSISHKVAFDPVKLTELGVAMLDGIAALAPEGDPADAHILQLGWAVDLGDAAAPALSAAGQHMAAGQMALMATSAREALAKAGVTFEERKR